jgi:peptidoglycan hydrolase-like protein with peptidoglycan-binding domain
MKLDAKKTEFYEYMGGYPMDVKTFQMITGLKPDGIAGPITQGKAREILPLLHTILGTDYKTAEEAIKDIMSAPDYWIGKLKTEPNLNTYTMKIINKMKGA